MEIKNYKQINKGALIARFDVAIPEWQMTIRGCTFFTKGDHLWIGMPNNPYQDKDGKTKHFDYIVFEKEAKVRFENKCIELIKAGKYEQYQQKEKQNDTISSMPF